MAETGNDRAKRRKKPFLLSADLGRRWEQPRLRHHLDDDQALLWVDMGVTGLLGRPWAAGAYLPIASTLWDVAITKDRLVASTFPHLPLLGKVRVFPVIALEAVFLTFHPLANAAILELVASDSRWKGKMLGMALDFAGAERVIREVYPGAVISGLRAE